MKIKKTGMPALAIGFVVLLILAIVIGLSLYNASSRSRVGLLTGYFRALAADDKASLAELTAPQFFTDLIIPTLAPGSYVLFDFGETEGQKTLVQRFLVIVDDGQDGQTAYLADMEYQRRTFGTDILAIRTIGKGTPVKP